jgi:hypothetical protein
MAESDRILGGFGAVRRTHQNELLLGSTIPRLNTASRRIGECRQAGQGGRREDNGSREQGLTSPSKF